MFSTSAPSSLLRRPYEARSAFTLVELMISVALSLLIILGINYVFKAVTDTVGTSTAISGAIRYQRATNNILSNDIATITSGSNGVPGLIIDSQINNQLPLTTFVYVDKATEDTKNTANAGLFRTDILSFFASGSFIRQTGGANPAAAVTDAFKSAVSTGQGFISYGHLLLPGTNSGGVPTYYAPADSDVSTTDRNTANRYASQWVLGRVQLVLDEVDLTGNIFDGTKAQNYVQYSAGVPLSPLAPLSTWVSAGTSSNATLQNFRYDLIGTPRNYTKIDNTQVGVTDSFKYFQKMVDEHDPKVNVTAVAPFWYDTTGFSFRYQCNQNPLRPVNSASIASTIPYFIPGVTDFIVEFAGDFVTQAADGTYTNDTPDNQLDFYYEPNKTDPNKVKKIQWYGLPRADDPTVIPVTTNAAYTTVGMRPAGVALEFEKNVSVSRYECAWRPVDGTAVSFPGTYLPPKMIRIIMNVRDPNGRLNQPQVFEYVFKLP